MIIASFFWQYHKLFHYYQQYVINSLDLCDLWLKAPPMLAVATDVNLKWCICPSQLFGIDGVTCY